MHGILQNRTSNLELSFRQIGFLNQRESETRHGYGVLRTRMRHPQHCLVLKELARPLWGSVGFRLDPVSPSFQGTILAKSNGLRPYRM